MTTKLPPGSPKLTMDGKEQPGGDILSDSDWEELDGTDPADKVRENLAKIAGKRKPASGRSAKG